MDELKTLETIGLTLPSPTYLFGAILFGIIGFAAYRHGKKASDMATKWGGIVLMLYPLRHIGDMAIVCRWIWDMCRHHYFTPIAVNAGGSMVKPVPILGSKHRFTLKTSTHLYTNST